jgi:beta-aspartyl-peptidase (threonine type)
MKRFSLVVHGGAGSLPAAGLDPVLEEEARTGLNSALDAGGAILGERGSALDAVVAAVCALENCRSFNAGRGAVLNADGRHRLEASVMDGATREAGAVTGITRVANPVLLAQRVMTGTRHVMLAGEGAEQFAEAEKLELMPEAYFLTRARIEQHDQLEIDGRTGGPLDVDHLGTVGACARDQDGRVAAATSTGGLSNQMHGRVGDSPIIGAGTWADSSCAVSATGLGEFFVRCAAASRVAAHMELAGSSLASAVRHVLVDHVIALGGTGGLIAVDSSGEISMQQSTTLMYRGFIRCNGERDIAIAGNSVTDAPQE